MSNTSVTPTSLVPTPLDWLGFGLSGASTIFNAITNRIDTAWQKKFSENQFDESKRQFNEAFDWQKNVQQTTWDRADSQIQRTVQDAQSAGLSPLAALGQGASAQTVSAPSSSVAGSGIGNAGANISAEGMLNMLSLAQEKDQFDKTLKLEYDKLSSGESEDEKNRKAEADNLLKTLDNALQIAKMNNATNKTKIGNDLMLGLASVSETVRANNLADKQQASRLYLDWYKEHHKPGSPMPYVCKNEAEYEIKCDNWYKEFSKYLGELGVSQEVFEQSELGASLGFGLGIGSNSSTSERSNSKHTGRGYSNDYSRGKGFGINKGVSASGSAGANSGSTSHQSNFQEHMYAIEAWLQSHPLPLPPGDWFGGKK